jgi:hypothetical protein
MFSLQKEFRNTTQLGIHDKRFYLEKGRNLDKCDNCDQRFKDKKVLLQHFNRVSAHTLLRRPLFGEYTALDLLT